MRANKKTNPKSNSATSYKCKMKEKSTTTSKSASRLNCKLQVIAVGVAVSLCVCVRQLWTAEKGGGVCLAPQYGEERSVSHLWSRRPAGPRCWCLWARTARESWCCEMREALLALRQSRKTAGVCYFQEALPTCCRRRKQLCLAPARWPRCWDCPCGCEPDRARVRSLGCGSISPQSIRGRSRLVCTRHHTFNQHGEGNNQRW